ncbi:MAG TPA: hypothetical protein VHH36_01855 [Candidatus Thermoplasmatota archaeon]|nr:hypothetical protein [Candidatus Thermoplasmatota archaeon]
MATLGLAALMLLAPTAAAHKTTYTDDGKVKITWGFLNEPAITMTKTGLDLILTDNLTGVPLEGVEGTLNASLVYGAEVHEFGDFRAQHGQKGRYTDVVTLTRPGLYSLRLVGAINGTSVDVTIPGAHEIHGIEETYFPALPEASSVDALAAEVAALKAQVAQLQAKAATQASTPAPVVSQDGSAASQGDGKNAVPTPTFGLVALALVAAVVLARRRA